MISSRDTVIIDSFTTTLCSTTFIRLHDVSHACVEEDGVGGGNFPAYTGVYPGEKMVGSEFTTLRPISNS
jgi:hypothetical protein